MTFVGQVIGTGAGLGAGNGHLHTGAGMAPAVRQADHARHHVFAAEHLDFDGADPRFDAHTLAIAEAAPGHILRVHQQLMARLALHQTLVVVHPGIVAAHMATTDQHQLTLDSLRLCGEARQVGDQHCRCRLNGLGFSLQASGEVRLQRPQVDAMGLLADG